MILPPIKDESGVIELKVPFKKPHPDDRLLLIEHQQCGHWGPFIIDTKAAEVTCKPCGAKLNPMYVLGILATKETNYHRSFERYQDEMKRLADRERTKCQHCKQMTRISRP